MKRNIMKFARLTNSILLSLLAVSCVSGALAGDPNAAPVRAERYAVESDNGAPRITLDGTPVRARIFWGRADLENGVSVNTERKCVDYCYNVSVDANKKGTLHFRFGRKPGTILLDDVSIIDDQTGEIIAGPYSFDTEKEFTDHWKIYGHLVHDRPIAEVAVKQAGDAPSSALVITIHEGASETKSDFHLYHKHELDLKAGHRYRVRYTIHSSEPRTVVNEFYLPGSPYVVLGNGGAANTHLANQTKLAADAEVAFVSFLFRNCWKTPKGTWDWTELDRICDTILAANPNALLIPRPGMNAPKWWLEQNPDEKMVWKDTKPFTLEYGDGWASPASLKYRQEACEALAAMIEHLEGKYGSSIAGYHPYGQNTGEWFTVNTWRGGLSGFGKAEGDSWRRWLRIKYQTSENLQKAWSDPGVTLENAAVPSAQARRDSMSRPFLDPKTNPADQALIDFNHWTQKEMTETVLALARTVRQATNGKKLSLFFYGYSFEFSGVSKGPAASAHYNLRALLDSPDIDIICSPISYFERQPGGGGSCMLTAESVSAAGKMYLYEDDTRTFLAEGSTAPGSESGADTLEATNHLLLRNTAESAVRNFALWWMDLGGTGWFEDSRLWDTMRSLKRMDDYFLKNPTPYRPEIGVFLDEASVLKITAGRFSSKMIGRVRLPLNRLGAPYGQYLLDDLLNGRVEPPKLCVILNPRCLADEQLKQLDAMKNRAELLFVDFEGLTEEPLREAAKKANVHFYTSQSCNVWANGPYAVLHGASDGNVDFAAPENSPVYDAISGEKLSDSGSCVLTLKKGETRVLYYGKQPPDRKAFGNGVKFEQNK